MKILEEFTVTPTVDLDDVGTGLDMYCGLCRTRVIQVDVEALGGDIPLSALIEAASAHRKVCPNRKEPGL